MKFVLQVNLNCCYVLLTVLFAAMQTHALQKDIDISGSLINDKLLTKVIRDALRQLQDKQAAPSRHTFLKFDSLNSKNDIPANSKIIIRGDSTLRLFNQTDIDHPSFDPSGFLDQALNDSLQPVEVIPAIGEPYFMFVPPTLLKDMSVKNVLINRLAKSRVKRHHPTVIQNVLGELQNYALVPIKSANGQTRYILLKNPKFVISNPGSKSQGRQPAPAIIQLGSNLPSALSGGKKSREIIRKIPVATPIDSIFRSSQGSEMTNSSSSVKQTRSSKKSVSTTQIVNEAAKPILPSILQSLSSTDVVQPGNINFGDMIVTPTKGSGSVLIPSSAIAGSAPVLSTSSLDNLFGNSAGPGSSTTGSGSPEPFASAVGQTVLDLSGVVTSGKNQQFSPPVSTSQVVPNDQTSQLIGFQGVQSQPIPTGKRSMIGGTLDLTNSLAGMKGPVLVGNEIAMAQGTVPNAQTSSVFQVQPYLQAVNQPELRLSSAFADVPLNLLSGVSANTVPGGFQNVGNPRFQPDPVTSSAQGALVQEPPYTVLPANPAANAFVMDVQNLPLNLPAEQLNPQPGSPPAEASLSNQQIDLALVPSASVPFSIPASWVSLRESLTNGANKPIPIISKSNAVKHESNSSAVVKDNISTSVQKAKELPSGTQAAKASSAISQVAGNATSVNQTSTNNVTISKVGDQHKIEKTVIVETKVDVEQNATVNKSDAASSSVMSDSAAVGGTPPDTASASAGAAEVAKEEKTAQVLKKTKKTTTILLTPGHKTGTGKAEISEIQHTVEELIHSNTSETAAAEKAASSNVEVKSSEPAHGGVVNGHVPHHDPHHQSLDHHAQGQNAQSHVHSISDAKSDTKKEASSNSTSVKKKSVTQTVITKNASDPVATQNSSGVASPDAALGNANSGFNVQHVEHVVQETEHKTHDTSEIVNHKEASLSDTHHH